MADTKGDTKGSKAPDLTSDAFVSTADDAAPAPQPVTSGEITREAEDHTHSYGTFSVDGSGNREERCVICTRKKGSRS